MALNKDQMRKDAVLSVGLNYRTNSHSLFFLSVLGALLGLLLKSYIADIPILLFIGYSWYYSRKFRVWEIANKDYIESLGYEVKNVKS